MSVCEICKKEITGNNILYLEKWPQYKFCSVEHIRAFLDKQNNPGKKDNTTHKILGK